MLSFVRRRDGEQPFSLDVLEAEVELPFRFGDVRRDQRGLAARERDPAGEALQPQLTSGLLHLVERGSGLVEAAEEAEQRGPGTALTPGRAGSSQPSCSHHSSASSAGVGPNAIASTDSTRNDRSRLRAPRAPCMVERAHRGRETVGEPAAEELGVGGAVPGVHETALVTRALELQDRLVRVRLELLSGAFCAGPHRGQGELHPREQLQSATPRRDRRRREPPPRASRRDRASLSGSAAASSRRSHADGMPGGESATARSRSAQRARTSPRSPARSAASVRRPRARVGEVLGAGVRTVRARRDSGVPARGGSRGSRRARRDPRRAPPTSRRSARAARPGWTWAALRRPRRG